MGYQKVINGEEVVSVRIPKSLVNRTVALVKRQGKLVRVTNASAVESVLSNFVHTDLPAGFLGDNPQPNQHLTKKDKEKFVDSVAIKSVEAIGKVLPNILILDAHFDPMIQRVLAYLANEGNCTQQEIIKQLVVENLKEKEYV